MEYPSINIIYDNRQSDDYQRLLGEFIEQDIVKFKFWEAICDKNSVVASINASHKMIVRYAREKKKPYVVIAEQDLTFSCIGAWDYFIKKMPDVFDLYLACTYIVPISNNKVCGFHLYCISEKFYDTFLSIPDDVHIDTYMDELGGDYKYCYPFPALQRAGYSFNNHAVVDYNTVLSEKDIWKGYHS